MPAPVPEPPVVTWEEKLGWIIRLEDQRILRDPNPPPPVILAPATRNRPAIVAPPPPSDLIRLLNDGEARVRRRAALALGRVGLPPAVEPLSARLGDEEPEVRQVAAFALGLIGDASARPGLLAALKDANPLVAGRAAEALGMLADRADAAAVSEMVQAHVKAGALSGLAPDEVSYPLAPPIEAARLGLYALVRLGSYEALAAAALDGRGQPVSTWWPVSYALQRLGDPRAEPALLALLDAPGRYPAAFAARGLGVVKAQVAAAPLRQMVEQGRREPAILIQAMRALASIGDASAAPALTGIVADGDADSTLRAEALTALGTLGRSDSLDLLLDLVSDPSPAIRAGAIRALARVDPEAFLTTLSGLEPDRDPLVRSAQAAALGTLPPAQGLPRLMAMLEDRDLRVIPAVLAALVASKAPDAGRILLERLRADDFAVRAAAANGLAELKAASAVPSLVEAYRAADGDSTYTARAAVLAALTRIDPAAARPLLEEALMDREWALRVRAAELLQQQDAGTRAAETIRPATGGRPVAESEWPLLVSPPFSPHAFIETDRGVIEIELAVLDAPLTVGNFMALARKGFFDGVAIHRVVPDFVVQDGDPRGDGEGGPGYTIRDEINQRPYLRGTVGMALDWADTGGSQFFITHSPQPHLDGRYTVFGHVVEGMDVVDRIQQGDVIRRVRIWDGVTAE
ncbi:MAG: HEAT repeat domain-containing protein [Acidobacteria bacterium]|nr:HEAT repeat domain-containing protein [Acidobacteriota bacterium]